MSTATNDPNVDEKRPSATANDASQAPSTHEITQSEKKLKRAGSQSDDSDTATAVADANRKVRPDGRVELTEDDAFEVTGYAMSEARKWSIICIIFCVQVSMNFNAAVYPNAVDAIAEHFNVGQQAARVGQMIFLISYAFGCELWAPWSEELGRKPILQLSLLLVNIWQIPAALAPNLGTIIVARFLGGISSAGGAVTLGMVADLWDSDDQQVPVAFVVLSSVFGSSISPVVGGVIQEQTKNQLDGFRWNFWIQLILGAVVQVLHYFIVPETRTTVLLDREAKRRRTQLRPGDAQYDPNLYGPNELKENRFSVHEILVIWARPFEMFVREPIVLCLSLLSGFSDALIFTFLDSFPFVFQQWGFGTQEIGAAFVPINLAYFLTFASYFYPIIRFRRKKAKDPRSVTPESRLWWLLFTAPLEPIGLIGFAWTSLGPPRVHWIAPMLFSALIGIANYAIYMGTIDYMIASYGPYSASATGGNALARDFLAGVAAMYSVPMYQGFGTDSLEWATTFLACVAVLVCIPVYIIYWKGPIIRERSKFAQTLAHEKDERQGRRAEKLDKSVAQIEHVERV